MSTAHRPTWHTAIGRSPGANFGTLKVSSRDQPSHMELKRRAPVAPADGELKAQKTSEYQRVLRERLENSESAHRAKGELEERIGVTRNFLSLEDAVKLLNQDVNAFPEDSDDHAAGEPAGDDASDSDDDEAMLLRELEKIKSEKEEARQRELQESLQSPAERERILSQNPLLAKSAPVRRWDEDVVFKNPIREVKGKKDALPFLEVAPVGLHFAFRACAACRTPTPQPTELDDVVVVVRLRADEPALEVRVDHAGRLRRLGPVADRPAADLVGAAGEVVNEVEAVVPARDDLVDLAGRAVLVLQVRRARLLRVERLQRLLELGAVGDDRAGVVVGHPLCDFGQPLVLLPHEVLLAQVNEVDHGLRRQEVVLVEDRHLRRLPAGLRDPLVLLQHLLRLGHRVQLLLLRLDLLVALVHLVDLDQRLGALVQVLQNQLLVDGLEVVDGVDLAVGVDDFIIFKPSHLHIVTIRTLYIHY
ncbi:protein CWC15-like protein [Babesia caballi]|uniref:Protein CWC15-like protein n=1 Tax=Babesia caballi TaxID=5871 RepID=A0AAV4LR64_BABCB|nr:protein CWC15-like protein [Babesia caballi]